MRIALINPFSFSYQGGVQEHVKALYKVLLSLGNEVKVIAPRQIESEDYGRDFILLGSSIVIPGNDSRISLSYAPAQEIDAVIKEEKFDVVHFHAFLPLISFQVLDSLKNIKAVKIFTSHSNVGGSSIANAFGPITELVVDSFVNRMDGVIAVSEAGEGLVKHFKGPLKIIPNGIDLTRFNPNVSKLDKYNDGKFNILFVGRLDPRKGSQVLLPSFAQIKRTHPECRLIIVGDGYLKDSLKKEVQDNRILDVEFVGEVKAENTPSYYASANIFCAPSIRGETFGIILLEGMATGVPVITTDIDGYREVVPPEFREYLSKPNDPVFLAGIINKFIEDKELRDKASKIGLAHAKKFDWNIIGERVLEFYKEVIYTINRK